MANLAEKLPEGMKGRSYILRASKSVEERFIGNANIFTEEELTIIKRARNTKSKSHPKSCDIITYQHATSLEALFGYLKLRKNEERIEEIISKILY